jgi:hypothetical protein
LSWLGVDVTPVLTEDSEAIARSWSAVAPRS